MCGIFTLLNNKTFQTSFVKEQFDKGRGRGPEFSTLQPCGVKCVVGFHRLAINGLNDISNQPIIIGDVTLICNGEIYNYKELYKTMCIEPKTQSDCEVIIHLYKNYGMSQTLKMLDGVFSFILCDANIEKSYSKLYVARDPYGIRPLYVLKPVNIDANTGGGSNTIIEPMYGFASELKSLSNFNKELPSYTIEHFHPGTYSKFIFPFIVSSSWTPVKDSVVYHSTPFSNYSKIESVTTIIENIQHYLCEAVKKRTLVTERPVACLLSGGLDSSLITALVNDCYKRYTTSELPLETFSIGLEGSEDLKYAKVVAEYLGTKHTEILLTEDDFINAIPEVITAIESYDTTTVRASIGNYLLGKYISENSDAKVIFNGDGSDELCGGYLYMQACPDAIEFDKETRRLLKDIHAFDVLRSDKCISSHGLEPRTPFLDRGWVQYYLSISPDIRYHYKGICEKYLLRIAFSKDYFQGCNGLPLLPDSVLWRRKEAFSDGVSKMSRSLYTIIQEKIPIKNDSFTSNQYKIQNQNEEIFPNTNEKMYYRSIFEENYPGLSNVVPYFWMPKYVDATDASARTLTIYSEV
uniref:asparagine synthase (glutamine-hydrolyzing) n=1 Tax=viral metagenome TaxID=1070528 RepID=A0A6C0AZI3_9ZZZZ